MNNHQNNRQRINRNRKRHRRVIRNRILFAVSIGMIFFLARTLFHLALPFLKEVHAAGQQLFRDDTTENTAHNALEEAASFHLHAGQTLIILDPGHGGHDVGCERPDVYEKDVNLALSFAAKQVLEDAGYNVLMTRTDDTFVSLEDRVAIANRYAQDLTDGAALLLSIHCNALEHDNVTDGMELYANAEASVASEVLLHALEKELPAATGSYVRKRSTQSDFFVVENTRIPACLIETGFLSSDEEARRLQDAAWQEKFAQGILRALENL